MKFEEKQSMATQPLVWIIFAFTFGVMLWAMMHPESKNYTGPKGPLRYLLFLPLGLAVAMLFYLELQSEIDETGIRFRFRGLPFGKMNILWSEIEHVELITYNPWLTGFGLRFLTKWGTVYNTQGRNGLQLTLKNRQRYLLGTQKPEEIKALLSLIKLNNHGTIL